MRSGKASAFKGLRVVCRIINIVSTPPAAQQCGLDRAAAALCLGEERSIRRRRTPGRGWDPLARPNPEAGGGAFAAATARRRRFTYAGGWNSPRLNAFRLRPLRHCTDGTRIGSSMAHVPHHDSARRCGRSRGRLARMSRAGRVASQFRRCGTPIHRVRGSTVHRSVRERRPRASRGEGSTRRACVDPCAQRIEASSIGTRYRAACV